MVLGFKKILSELNGVMDATTENNTSSPEKELNQKLIDMLNEDLSGLYTAIVQYVNHVALIEGAQFMGYVEDLKQHLSDDFQQSINLAEKIAYLGGKPTLHIKEAKGAENSIEMIRLDAELQKNNIDKYRKTIKYANDIGEFAIANFYMELIEHEEEHHNTTLAFLSKC